MIDQKKMTRFRTWKSGKRWLFAASALAVLAGGVLVGTSVKADTTTFSSTAAVTSSDVSSLAASSSVSLATSSTVSEATIDSSAASSIVSSLNSTISSVAP